MVKREPAEEEQARMDALDAEMETLQREYEAYGQKLLVYLGIPK
jgi:ParB family chromosome partitioning protein